MINNSDLNTSGKSNGSSLITCMSMGTVNFAPDIMDGQIMLDNLVLC